MKPDRDVDRKFDVPPGLSLPDLTDVAGVAALTPPREAHLHATFYDTEDLRLAEHHIMLRRRVGGEDQGWHLKVPVDTVRRRELWLPLHRATTVPAALTHPVKALVRGRDLVPVAVLNTQRVERRVLKDGGAPGALLTDDSVRGELVGTDATAQQWREVEVERVDEDGRLLDSIGVRLESAGLNPSPHPTKLARVLHRPPSGD